MDPPQSLDSIIWIYHGVEGDKLFPIVCAKLGFSVDTQRIFGMSNVHPRGDPVRHYTSSIEELILEQGVPRAIVVTDGEGHGDFGHQDPALIDAIQTIATKYAVSFHVIPRHELYGKTPEEFYHSK